MGLDRPAATCDGPHPHATITGMTLSAPLIEEITQEGAITRRVLERVPEDKLSWKPHDKSMSLGRLALHVAQVPGAIAFLLQQPSFEGPPPPQAEAQSRAEILSALDDSLTRAKASLHGWTDDDMRAAWQFTIGGKTVLAAPRAGVVRSLMLNHWYHHRGQLTVYLRLLGAAVPPVYGPSADENPFG